MIAGEKYCWKTIFGNLDFENKQFNSVSHQIFPSILVKVLSKLLENELFAKYAKFVTAVSLTTGTPMDMALVLVKESLETG